ncbi:MAG TPA: hypothetical protein VF173_07140 [Thermoanaerobaculia bacterium]|nr:hypothetical protein [Thermoanaerobaculia bacterium]
MDENHTRYGLKAPGRTGSSSSLHLPGRGSFPQVDDHLVEPEVTRDEILGGRRIVAMPANPPHADRQSALDQILQSYVARGYKASAELLTRVDQDSDFACDACMRKKGVDPVTGTRYLEELAFEVVSEQKTGDVTDKANRMHRRGVRRIFAIFLKSDQVCEWAAESQGWRPMDPGSQIEDPCLAAPLSVAALLDAGAADVAVVKGLAAQGNPELRRLEALAEAQGKAKTILVFLEARGLAVSEAQRQEILSCQDLERLDRWSRQAVLASSVDEITSVS